jgi:hypothetical protein
MTLIPAELKKSRGTPILNPREIIAKINELVEALNNSGVGYTHPLTHPPSIIEETTSDQFVSAAQAANIHAPGSDNQDLSGLQPKETGKGLSANDFTTALKTAYDGAVTHAGSSHAPATAQKNSDILQTEIEAKLTGAITTHSHAGGANPFTAKLVLAADKPTGANVTPVTLGLSFNYEANSQYAIDIYAIVAPAVATTGCGFMIDVSTAVTYVGTFVSHQLAVSGTLSGAGSVGDLAATSSGISSGMVLAAAAGSNFVYGGGILITGANTGTATFFFRSETTAVTTCKTGTIIRVMKI